MLDSATRHSHSVIYQAFLLQFFEEHRHEIRQGLQADVPLHSKHSGNASLHQSRSQGGQGISLRAAARTLARCQYYQPGSLVKLKQACRQLLARCNSGFAVLVFQPQIRLVIRERPVTYQVKNIVGTPGVSVR